MDMMSAVRWDFDFTVIKKSYKSIFYYTTIQSLMIKGKQSLKCLENNPFDCFIKTLPKTQGMVLGEFINDVRNYMILGITRFAYSCFTMHTAVAPVQKRQFKEVSQSEKVTLIAKKLVP